jgi:tetratricopeptide (TPR) repeat protein
LDRALEYFQEAVQIDPQYALGYAGLADAYFILGDNGFLSPQETSPKAKAAVRKALELDDSLAEAHATQASLLQFSDWDWNGAAREFNRALELNPGYATAHHWHSQLLSSLGRHQEAIAEIKKARTLDPLSPRINANVGAALSFAGHKDEAIQELQKALAFGPDHAITHRYLSSAYSEKGMHEKAIAEAQKAIQDGDSLGDLNFARILARAGERQQARKIVERALLSNREYVAPDYLAFAYAALGETDKAFASLEKAYAERSSSMVNLLINPGFNPLRSDPRFKSLRRRMRFPD